MSVIFYKDKELILDTGRFNRDNEPLRKFSYNEGHNYLVFKDIRMWFCKSTWKIENGKLFLIDFEGNIATDSEPYEMNYMSHFGSFPVNTKKVGLDYLFPNQKKIFAEWFTGQIRASTGEEIRDLGSGSVCFPIYEKDVIFQFNKGVLISTKKIDNRFKIKSEDIIGTMWIILSESESIQNKFIEFYPNGVLKYSYDALEWYNDGKWELKDRNRKILIFINNISKIDAMNSMIAKQWKHSYEYQKADYIAMFHGHEDSPYLSGTVTNFNGEKWTFKGFKDTNNDQGFSEISEETIMGTKWKVTTRFDKYGFLEEYKNVVFKFNSNGVFRDGDVHPVGRRKLINGKEDYKDLVSNWELKDNKIIISENNGYAISIGRIRNGYLFGSASNRKGEKWTFRGEQFSTENIVGTTWKIIVDSFEKEDKQHRIRFYEFCTNGMLKNRGDGSNLKSCSKSKWELKGEEIIISGGYLTERYKLTDDVLVGSRYGTLCIHWKLKEINNFDGLKIETKNIIGTTWKVIPEGGIYDQIYEFCPDGVLKISGIGYDHREPFQRESKWELIGEEIVISHKYSTEVCIITESFLAGSGNSTEYVEQTLRGNPVNTLSDNDIDSILDKNNWGGQTSNDYGYNSWREMAFHVAFEGDIDAWEHYNQ